MQVYEYCLVWHVYTVPILGLCNIYIKPVKVIQIKKKKNTPLYIYYVLFLNWSCQSCCSRRNQKEKNTPLIFDFFSYYNEIDNSSLKTKHNIYPCECAVSRYMWALPCLFTKKVHYQTTGRGVRCFESSASIKGIGIVESYGRRRRVAQLSYVEWPAIVWTRHSASVREDASPLVHSEGVDNEVRRLRALHRDNRRTPTR